MKQIVLIERITNPVLKMEELVLIHRKQVNTELRVSVERYRQMAVAEGVDYHKLRNKLKEEGLTVIADESVPYHDVFVVGDPGPKSLGGPTIYREKLDDPEYRRQMELQREQLRLDC